MRLKVAGAGGTFGTEENISVHSSVLRKLFYLSLLFIRSTGLSARSFWKQINNPNAFW